MTEFTVSGEFQSRDGWSPFETTVEAENESVAQERAYATLGGRHGLKRTQVRVEGVSA
jgi:large subunit ribosomal protein LX